MSLSKLALAAVLLAAYAGTALAKPVTFVCDPAHTHPSFAADHLGLSVWRGTFAKSACTIVLDQEQHTGTVDVTVDASSIEFGLPKLNEHVRSAPNLLDASRYPTAIYKGKLTDFVNGKPTKVEGDFTLHGVTHPLTLTIDSFACKSVMNQYRCGADATAHFDRDQYGVDFGKPFGFLMWVRLRIQVEALQQG
jgi:polyisoprenoid-binding protein YceI